MRNALIRIATADPLLEISPLRSGAQQPTRNFRRHRVVAIGAAGAEGQLQHAPGRIVADQPQARRSNRMKAHIPATAQHRFCSIGTFAAGGAE